MIFKQIKDKRQFCFVHIFVTVCTETFEVSRGSLKTGLVFQLCIRNYDLKSLKPYFYLLCFVTVKLVVFITKSVNVLLNSIQNLSSSVKHPTVLECFICIMLQKYIYSACIEHFPDAY